MASCVHNTKVISAEHAVLRFEWSPPTNAVPSGAKVVIQFTFRDVFPSLMVDGQAELYIGSEPTLISETRPIVSVPARTATDQTSTLLDHMYESFVVLLPML